MGPWVILTSKPILESIDVNHAVAGRSDGSIPQLASLLGGLYRTFGIDDR
jgi:hypothetical protein